MPFCCLIGQLYGEVYNCKSYSHSSFVKAITTHKWKERGGLNAGGQSGLSCLYDQLVLSIYKLLYKELVWKPNYNGAL